MCKAPRGMSSRLTEWPRGLTKTSLKIWASWGRGGEARLSAIPRSLVPDKGKSVVRRACESRRDFTVPPSPTAAVLESRIFVERFSRILRISSPSCFLSLFPFFFAFCISFFPRYGFCAFQTWEGQYSGTWKSAPLAPWERKQEMKTIQWKSVGRCPRERQYFDTLSIFSKQQSRRGSARLQGLPKAN